MKTDKMKTASKDLSIEISVGVAGDEVMVHLVRYKCQAWDNGDSDPQNNDSGIYVNRDPQQVHPEWVTTAMLYHCDAAAEVQFVNEIQKKGMEAA